MKSRPATTHPQQKFWEVLEGSVKVACVYIANGPHGTGEFTDFDPQPSSTGGAFGSPRGPNGEYRV